ncbi:4538_t:CDS:2, partial [Funneliformis geosporum]
DKKSQSHKKREAENIVQDAFDFTATSAPEKNHVTKISMTETPIPVTENTDEKNSVVMLSVAKSKPLLNLAYDRDGPIIDSEEEISNDQDNVLEILPEVNALSTPQITPAKADVNDLTDLKEEDFCGDPEEKRKHIIGLVLEKFSYLSLDDSDERRDTFNLDSSALSGGASINARIEDAMGNVVNVTLSHWKRTTAKKPVAERTTANKTIAKRRSPYVFLYAPGSREKSVIS